MHGDAVEARVGVGDFDRDRIEVAEPDLALDDFRRGDGEHAGAAADVEDLARPSALQQAIEMQQAAARRAVVAGAEGEAGLDLDADVVRPDRSAAVRAVDEEAPCPHRREAGERIGDPIALVGQAEFDPTRRVVASRRGDELA